MKDEVKNFLKAITKKDVKEAEEILPTLYKAIDKALKNNIIKKNNAARKKSKFAKKVAVLKK